MHDIATPSDEWDQQPLGRLYERCPLRGRQILECLYRRPGEWVTDIVLDTNVGVSIPRLHQSIENLQQRCRCEFGRELPFERARSDGQRYRMSRHIAEMLNPYV